MANGNYIVVNGMALDAIEKIINDMGATGCPEGSIYASLIGFGIPMDEFRAMIRVLIAMRRIERRGKLLFSIRDTDAN